MALPGTVSLTSEELRLASAESVPALSPNPMGDLPSNSFDQKLRDSELTREIIEGLSKFLEEKLVGLSMDEPENHRRFKNGISSFNALIGFIVGEYSKVPQLDEELQNGLACFDSEGGSHEGLSTVSTQQKVLKAGEIIIEHLFNLEQLEQLVIEKAQMFVVDEHRDLDLNYQGVKCDWDVAKPVLYVHKDLSYIITEGWITQLCDAVWSDDASHMLMVTRPLLSTPSAEYLKNVFCMRDGHMTITLLEKQIEMANARIGDSKPIQDLRFELDSMHTERPRRSQGPEEIEDS